MNRSCGWLFSYINEQWIRMLATQIYLTTTETVCCVALFSGYLGVQDNQGKKLLVLGEKASKSSYASSDTYSEIIKIIVLAIKLQHISFTAYDQIFGGSSFFGDHYRNFFFTLDDTLFIWLFLWELLMETRNSRSKQLKVCGSTCLVWVGLFASQRMFGSDRVA